VGCLPAVWGSSEVALAREMAWALSVRPDGLPGMPVCLTGLAIVLEVHQVTWECTLQLIGVDDNL